ncbi:MAG: hypothetical protein M2R45_02371 [Verrucomicrobia subdivision 3 bacterium]|nr:hypothetical protein [Limisphaerales bacterium]MCS1414922.1 hypothetical protein [Limisphaerales bacterium]
MTLPNEDQCKKRHCQSDEVGYGLRPKSIAQAMSELFMTGRREEIGKVQVSEPGDECLDCPSKFWRNLRKQPSALSKTICHVG